MNLEELKKEIQKFPPEKRKDKLEELMSELSPEDLEELKKQECIFCMIASKKVSSHVIYEDLDYLAVLDILPATPGHVILFPKQHIISLQNLDNEIFAIAKKIALVLSQLTGNVNILLQSGALAGQKTEHMMIHLIPRVKEDKVNITWPTNKVDDQILLKLKEEILSKFPKKKEENLESYSKKKRLP